MLNTQQIAESVKALEGSFKIGDPSLEEIHDAGNREVLGLSDEDFTLYAHMSASYEGEPPEDIRVLNGLVLNIVSDNLDEFNTQLALPVTEYLKANYGDGDLSDITDGLEDFIWESQVDYLPMLDPENKRVYFDIEMLLVMEENKG